MVLKCFIHEIEYFIGYFLLLIEEYLLLVVLPIECQVLDTNAVPVVCELHTRSVHHSLDFVRDDKLQVLRAIFVANEETVLDLDDANQIVLLEGVRRLVWRARCRKLLWWW